VWYLSGPPAMARWHVNARANGGLAGSYGRVGPAGRAHCITCAGAVETTMHMYLHCPLHCAPRVRLLQAVDAWRVARASDALAGEPALVPSWLEALRWVHSDSALVEGRLVGASAVQLGGGGGGCPTHAACVFHREAVKAGAARAGGGCAQREARLRLCEVRLHGHHHPPAAAAPLSLSPFPTSAQAHSHGRKHAAAALRRCLSAQR
jgi:hypothetical protein